MGDAQARAVRRRRRSPIRRGAQRWITGAESRARGASAAREQPTRSPSASGPCSPTIRRSPCATLRRRASRRGAWCSTRQLRTPSDVDAGADGARAPTTMLVGGRARHRSTARRSSEQGVRRRAAEPTLDAALDALRARGVRSLFVEGGARLAGSFLERVARRPPHYLSVTASCSARTRSRRSRSRRPDSRRRSRERRVVDERRFGDDTMTIYALHEVPCSPG